MISIATTTALDTRRVRVVFSGTVPVADPTVTTDALNQANWTLAGQPPGPVAAVVCSSVECYGDSTTTVDVLTDTDMSCGQSYLVTAKADADGGIDGVGASPLNQQVFVAWTPLPVPGRFFDVADMIPRKNWREDETGDLAKFVAALQDMTTILLNSIDRWTDILDPELCPAGFLDAMLAGLGNPFSFLSLSTVEKRRLVGLLAAMYREKGTEAGVRAAILLFTGWEATILTYNAQGMHLSGAGMGEEKTSHLGDRILGGGEFILGGRGVEYDFDVRVGTPTGRALTADEETKIRALVTYMKPAQARLFGVTGAFPPPRPQAYVTVSQHATGVLRVEWPEVTGATGYRIFYRDHPCVTPLNSAKHDVSGVLIWDNSGLSAGVTMYYRVAALKTAVEGVLADEVSATAT